MNRAGVTLTYMRARKEFWDYALYTQNCLIEAKRARLDGRSGDWAFYMLCAAANRRHAATAVLKGKSNG